MHAVVANLLQRRSEEVVIYNASGCEVEATANDYDATAGASARSSQRGASGHPVDQLHHPAGRSEAHRISLSSSPGVHVSSLPFDLHPSMRPPCPWCTVGPTEALGAGQWYNNNANANASAINNVNCMRASASASATGTGAPLCTCGSAGSGLGGGAFARNNTPFRVEKLTITRYAQTAATSASAGSAASPSSSAYVPSNAAYSTAVSPFISSGVPPWVLAEQWKQKAQQQRGGGAAADGTGNPATPFPLEGAIAEVILRLHAAHMHRYETARQGLR